MDLRHTEQYFKELQRLRESYRPEKVRVLYVAESPPDNGTFFYKGTSNLCDALKKSFSIAFDRNWDDDKQFLEFFRDKGCYLDDLCEWPVHVRPKKEQSFFREKGILPLAKRIADMTPDAVIILLKRIEQDVQRAVEISEAKLKSRPSCTPFPIRSETNMRNCIKQNSKILTTLIEKGII